MTFLLDDVVPWGRSYDEYVAMFNLTEEELGLSILGCADGPASFNAEMALRGGDVTSIDPLYQYTADEIRSRIDATYLKIMAQLNDNLDRFVWRQARSPEHLGQIRMRAMEKFLIDYQSGQSQNRYLPIGLPQLPFEEKSFDMALCSHFLFLYPDQLSVEFHIESCKQMVRIAEQARIFPLLTLDGQPYPHLETVLSGILQFGSQYTVEEVDYEFQRGGNQMLKVFKPS